MIQPTITLDNTTPGVLFIKNDHSCCYSLLSLKMNDYEVTKLRKELQRKQELLKEEREDRESTEKRLVLIQAVLPHSCRKEIASTAN